MKRFLLSLLTLAFFLPAMASCRNTPGNTPDSAGTDILRPLETITLTNVCRGDFTLFPEGFTASTSKAFLYGGQFYIPGSITQSQAAPRRLCCVLSPEDGSVSWWDIPMFTQPTDEMERTSCQNLALGENAYAIVEYNLHVDTRTNKVTRIAYQLTATDAEGNILYTRDPETLVQQRVNPYTGNAASYAFHLASMHYGANGTLYLVTEYSVIALSPAGEKLYETGAGICIDNVLRTADGRILVQYTQALDRKTLFAYMDDEAKGFSEPLTLPDPGFEEYTLLLGEGYDFYFQTADGLYGMNASDPAPALLCSWKNSGISASSIRQLLILSEDIWLCVIQDQLIGTDPEYAILRRVPEEEIAPKYIVTLGDDTSKIDFTPYVSKFNRRSDTYYIVIRDYQLLSQEGGPTLQEDILAGNAPDIICSFSRKSMENLAGKGAFADLNPYLDATPAFRADLLSCVLEPYETNGKLYGLASNIELYGMIGKTENLPAPENWTPDAFFALLDEAKQNGAVAVTDTSRQEMERMLIYYNLPTFIDYETGNCTFTSELFLATLSYLKEVPEQRTVLSEVQDLRKGYRENKVLLDVNSYLGSFEAYLTLRAQFGNAALTWLGIPTPAGGMPILHVYNSYFIADDSPVKEGGWEFIRYMLSEELPLFNGGISEYFPVTRTMFSRQAEKEKKLYHIFALDSKAHSMIAWDGVNIPRAYDPKTQIAAFLTNEDVQFILNLLESRAMYTNARAATDETVTSLIAEELAAYYAGNSTAEEAARRIQSRVSICLAERAG